MKRPDPHFIKTSQDTGAESEMDRAVPQPEGQTAESRAAGEASKYRRTAKFLILIGADEAARILPHLDPDQIEAVSREIAAVRGITPEEGGEILGEFRTLLSSSYRFAGTPSGGPETARRILQAAFGAERAEALLNKALPPEKPFSFLEDLEPEQTASLLKDESPAAAALVLSRLSPPCSAAVLARFNPQFRARTVRRIARPGPVSSAVLAAMSEALKEKALNLGGLAAGRGDMADIDGVKALARILRQGDASLGERILRDLGEQDPGVGRNLKEALLTPEDLSGVEDRALQRKLETMPDRDIALLLKGKGREFTEKLLSNVSGRRAQEIRDEGEQMGPVPRRDVEEATRNFLDWLWQSGPEVLQTTKDLGV
jgi:flagellar motor switch protein FliG